MSAIVLAAQPRPSSANSSHVTCPPKRGARRRKRETWAYEPNRAVGLCFSVRLTLFAKSIKEAERRQTLIRILRTIGCGSALLGQLACRRSTTVLA